MFCSFSHSLSLCCCVVCVCPGGLGYSSGLLALPHTCSQSPHLQPAYKLLVYSLVWTVPNLLCFSLVFRASAALCLSAMPHHAASTQAHSPATACQLFLPLRHLDTPDDCRHTTSFVLPIFILLNKLIVKTFRSILYLYLG